MRTLTVPFVFIVSLHCAGDRAPRPLVDAVEGSVRVIADPNAQRDDAGVIGRVVTVNGKDQSHTLVDFDAEAQTLTFRSGELPRIMKYAQNTHRVEATEDGRTQLTIDVYLVPGGPAKLLRGALRKKFTRYLEAYVDEARVAIERGDVIVAGGAR